VSAALGMCEMVSAQSDRGAISDIGSKAALLILASKTQAPSLKTAAAAIEWVVLGVPMLKTNVFVATAALLALTGCATTTPGWSGSGAEPFDQALSECSQQADQIADKQERKVTLEACMANKGWMPA